MSKDGLTTKLLDAEKVDEIYRKFKLIRPKKKYPKKKVVEERKDVRDDNS